MNSFLGRGWAFPPTFVRSTATVEMLDEQANVERSLQIILATFPGERLMRPEFGCNLHAQVFESVDASFRTYVEDLVREAILRDEPRILLDDLTLDYNSTDGVLLISVDYIIKTTNARGNYVYPYYLLEANVAN